MLLYIYRPWLKLNPIWILDNWSCACSCNAFLQVRKEKLGDRVTALQQLVAPFGKVREASFWWLLLTILQTKLVLGTIYVVLPTSNIFRLCKRHVPFLLLWRSNLKSICTISENLLISRCACRRIRHRCSMRPSSTSSSSTTKLV